MGERSRPRSRPSKLSYTSSDFVCGAVWAKADQESSPCAPGGTVMENCSAPDPSVAAFVAEGESHTAARFKGVGSFVAYEGSSCHSTGIVFAVPGVIGCGKDCGRTPHNR